MKITKRQLKNLVKEAMPRGGAPDVVGAVTGVYGEKNRRQKDPRLAVMDYKEWARDYMGTSSGANSSSVLATYAVDQELSEEDWMPIALAMDFTPRDVGLDIARQQKEYEAGGVLSDEASFERGFKEANMRITKKYLKKIINEEIQNIVNEQKGNPPPEKNSNWRSFADDLNIGVLDLDNLAYDLGFTDFYDMDISIAPRALSSRDEGSFIVAARNASVMANDMEDAQILAAAQG